MAAAPSMENPRRLLRGFFSFELCKELEFIHRSSGTVGYRPSVFSTTLPHLAATNCGHFILPFLPLRDRLKDAVEETFGCEFELFVEFTGLISWCKGASIGWHSDDNKPYLRQRDFAAVCYLNNHEKDFRGGLFHFKDGEPSSVAPIAGDVLIYTADERNIHCVDEVIDGERLTLTLWFTRDCSHDEDAKHLVPCIGFRRMGQALMCAMLEGDEVLVKEFLNSLHALQVLQFCYWRASELAKGREEVHRQGSARPAILKRTINLKLPLPHDDKLAVEILGGPSCNCIKLQFKWEDLVLGSAKWEEYVSQLHRNMLVCIPSWLSNHTLSLDNHIVEFVHAT
ncbi:uncharacterized protein LOC122008182 isoform X2 [Zingiber officinale]|uniref:uncharacterized protein LOC122008182 isoform X2 n=1 Tax=Zingiber officinale TaxID=94328 RepID=UPI001C4BC4AE|nr:uncharacterized protein LOC122008182 isoform X2 [Zingiber officinale]